MAHSHDHSHSHGHRHHATKNIKLAFVLNLSFAVIELVGGLLTNSIAILSDSLHDFGDSLSLGVALYLEKYSQKKADSRYSYGYKRFSLLGAIFISLVLLVGSIIIVSECVERLMTPQAPNVAGMFWLAVLGLGVNGFAVLRMRNGGKSLNERAITLHLMEDVLGWAAVLVGSIVMYFVHLPILDPIISVAIAIWVLINVYRNIKSSMGVFLQGVPNDVELAHLVGELCKIDNVDSIHDLHIWSLDGEQHILSLHVVTPDNLTDSQRRALKAQVRKVASHNKIAHTTQELETLAEASEECNCGLP